MATSPRKLHARFMPTVARLRPALAAAKRALVQLCLSTRWQPRLQRWQLARSSEHAALHPPPPPPPPRNAATAPFATFPTARRLLIPLLPLPHLPPHARPPWPFCVPAHAPPPHCTTALY